MTFIDVRDPYGSPVEVYRATARSIQRAVRQLYAREGLRRISTGEATGSHAVGVFSRAAREFEGEIREFVRRELGLAVSVRATLGKLNEVLKSSSEIRDTPDMLRLSSEIAEANSKWVRLKHKEDCTVKDLASGIEAMIRGFDLVAELSSMLQYP